MFVQQLYMWFTCQTNYICVWSVWGHISCEQCVFIQRTEEKNSWKQLKILRFFPLYIPSVWFNISSKIATSDVRVLRVCLCVLSLLRSINNECREQRALDGSAKSFWQTKDHWGQSSANRLKWIQQEMLCLCLHVQSYVTITNISIRTMVKLSHLRDSVKWHFL